MRKETQLGIFVVHNKYVSSHSIQALGHSEWNEPSADTWCRLKEKAGELSPDVQYFSAVDTPDVWLAYPWECDTDIEEHDADRAKNAIL